MAPSRLGRRHVRAGPRRGPFELAPAAGRSSVAGAVSAVVIVEVALSLLGEQPEDAEVYVGHCRLAGSGVGIETAIASGSSLGESSHTNSLNPRTPSAPTIGCGGWPHSGQAARYAAAAGANRNRHLEQRTCVTATLWRTWVTATLCGRSLRCEPWLLRWPWPTASLPFSTGMPPRKREELGSPSAPRA
jgi:hypothetical protein